MTGRAGRTALVIAVTTIGLAGCKPDRAVRTGALIGKGTKRPAPVSQARSLATGTVEGLVRFRGRAPEPTTIDMGADLVCSVAGGVHLTEQFVVNDGGLANVYVYLKDGPAEAMRAAQTVDRQPVVLDQQQCRDVPHVVAVMRAGTVEFRNSDGTMHNIHVTPVANEALDVAQGAKGAPLQKRFDRPETMIPVRSASHPWMMAYINVSATPFFAVSGRDGRFTISGLPPGTYTLAAVHERLGEQKLKVTVAERQRTAAEFVYSAR